VFTHITVGSNDLARSRRFYDALFEVAGAKPGREDAKGRIFYVHKGTMFLIGLPIDNQPATRGNGMTIGLAMDSAEQVDAWHRAGVAAGGTAIEDPPGRREGLAGPMHLAYLRDPDGNKVCAVYRLPA
jgi:catechol 2,3-dioxygenase-like lactoylglutathione lyase family enzyme